MDSVILAFSDFLSNLTDFEPFIYALSAMSLSAVVGLVFYLIRGES